MYDLFSLLLQVDILPENWLIEYTEDLDVNPGHKDLPEMYL